MRVPSVATFVRTFYALANGTISISGNPLRTLSSHRPTLLQPLGRASLLSMPTIPFLGTFFGTSSSKMSFPVEKDNDEWQAVLSKGA